MDRTFSFSVGLRRRGDLRGELSEARLRRGGGDRGGTRGRQSTEEMEGGGGGGAEVEQREAEMGRRKRGEVWEEVVRAEHAEILVIGEV